MTFSKFVVLNIICVVLFHNCKCFGYYLVFSYLSFVISVNELLKAQRSRL